MHDVLVNGLVKLAEEFCLFVCFVALRPKSTAESMSKFVKILVRFISYENR